MHMGGHVRGRKKGGARSGTRVHARSNTEECWWLRVQAASRSIEQNTIENSRNTNCWDHFPLRTPQILGLVDNDIPELSPWLHRVDRPPK